VSDVLVIGSGASAVHFAAEALERGRAVTMLDVGHARPAVVRPDDSFAELKANLEDPAAYFLGEDFGGVLWPGSKGEYYGIPPHKDYVFRGVDRFAARARGFEPLVSFGQGGLAEAWTGGVFPFNEAELADFPFGWEELAPYYGRVAERIGISGAGDDLARFVPVHAHLGEPLDLDLHSARLLERYAERRSAVNRLGAWLGRSRVATLRADRPGRNGCTYLGRCLWGCPRESLWTPLVALRVLREHPRFTYVGGVYVEALAVGDGGRIRRVVTRRLEGGAEQSFECERVALGAGTLSSARIVLESLRRRSGGTAPALAGLMDNRQVLLPFVNLGMIARPADTRSYQYHNLALGLEGRRSKEYVHGLVTTLKSALIHPIVQSMPLDLRGALGVVRDLHAALGILNVNYHDERRPGNAVSLERDGRLVIDYAPPPDEPERLRRTLRRLKRVLWKLGCVVPPGMAHVRPMGASVHYSGTLPMSAAGGALTTTPDGQSRDFENLWLIDGSTLPFLPAKNLTFTLMALATRVAERMG
jgi:choline dehydrogenase-like flavoprotein